MMVVVNVVAVVVVGVVIVIVVVFITDIAGVACCIHVAAYDYDVVVVCR